MIAFSDDVMHKAHTLLSRSARDVQVWEDVTHPAIWWVRSSSGATVYRVQSDFDPETRALSWLTCTCPHGLNAAGEARCYHAAAVLLRLKGRSGHG